MEHTRMHGQLVLRPLRDSCCLYHVTWQAEIFVQMLFPNAAKAVFAGEQQSFKKYIVRRANAPSVRPQLDKIKVRKMQCPHHFETTNEAHNSSNQGKKLMRHKGANSLDQFRQQQSLLPKKTSGRQDRQIKHAHRKDKDKEVSATLPSNTSHEATSSII